jgi:acyl-CoA oxidase
MTSRLPQQLTAPTNTVKALTGALFGSRFDEVHQPWRQLVADGFFHSTRNLPPDEQRRIAYERLRYLNDHVGPADRLATDVEALTAMHEWLPAADCSVAVIAGIHYNLFLGSLLDHEPDEHRDIRGYASMHRIGTFLCTELDHGNSAAGLETTAVFDPDTGGFVLNTPHPGAAKYMPNTSLVGGPKSAVVAARLMVDRRDEGVFLFLTPLSDEHGLARGVSVQALPERIGAPVDHCLTSFDQVRLPRSAMLSGTHGRIQDGRFTSTVPDRNRRFLYSIGRVAIGKMCMGASSAGAARVAVAIAVRYAHTRHTSGLSGDYVPLFAYRSHHVRLLKALATVYAATALHRGVVRYWIAHSETDRRGAERMAAIAKGWITWQMRDVLHECRERCGAQGLSASNGLGDFVTTNEGAITAEGDNLPIWLKAAGQLVQGPPTPPPTPPTDTDLTNPRFLQYLLTSIVIIWEQRARSVFTQNTSPDPLTRWNAATTPALELVRAQAQLAAGTALFDAAETATDAQAGRLLFAIHRLFALHHAIDAAGLLAAASALTIPQIPELHTLLDTTITELVPHTLELVSAFAIPDTCLDRYPLARQTTTEPPVAILTAVGE